MLVSPSSESPCVVFDLYLGADGPASAKLSAGVVTLDRCVEAGFAIADLGRPVWEGGGIKLVVRVLMDAVRRVAIVRDDESGTDYEA